MQTLRLAIRDTTLAQCVATKTTSCRGLSHVASAQSSTHTHTQTHRKSRRHTHTHRHSPGRGVTFANTKLLMPPLLSLLPLRVAAIKVFICHCQDAGCLCLSVSTLQSEQLLPLPVCPGAAPSKRFNKKRLNAAKLLTANGSSASLSLPPPLSRS